MLLDRPVVAPLIIGRERELEAISALLDQGAGTLLVSGEAGIGKSRLMREALANATARGFRILQGASFDRDHSLPYAPFLDLWRASAAQQPDETRKLLREIAPGFLHLLPELDEAPASTAAPFSPEQEQRRLFHEIASVFAALAEERPLLVLIEDVHWSDETSLELLLFLARRAATTPLLLLVTYRSDDHGAALSHFLAGIDRERLASELSLRSLNQSEVEQQLRAILHLPRPASTFFVRSLHGLTAGNPFFVEEVLRSLIAGGDLYPSAEGWQRKSLDQLRVPRSVEDAVRRRGAMLSPTAQEVLTLAAVAGRRVDFALLQGLSGLDEATLLAALKELLAAQLLIGDAEDRFAFRHALTRQAIYAGLLARERRAWHARVAAVIESGAGGGTDAVADLSYHLFEAEEWAKARDLARAAGDRARALYAPQAAIEHYTRAITAATRLGDLPDGEIFRARGKAFDAIGDFNAALADYEAALRAAELTGDATRILPTLLDLGLLWSSRDYPQAHAYLLRAVGLARTMPDVAALGHALNRLGNWHANQEEPDEALRRHDEARRIFERLDDRRGLAETLDLQAMAFALGGDLEAAHQTGARAAKLYEALDDRLGLASVLSQAAMPGELSETMTVVSGATIPEAIVTGERALALSRDIDWRSGEAFSLAILGQVWAGAGDFGRAMSLLTQSIAICEEIDHRQWMIQARWGLAQFYAIILAPELAQVELEAIIALAHEVNSAVWTNMAVAGLASALVSFGQTAAAADVLRTYVTDETPRRTLGQRLLWLARAELALATNQPQQALTIIDQLYAAQQNLADEAKVPRLAQLKGTALASLGQPETAERLLRGAQLTARSNGSFAALWSLHVSLAHLLRDRGRNDEAEREEALARGLAERLAASLPPGELRERFRRSSGLDKDAAGTTPEEGASSGGLTPREREVATHIAAGESSRAIAEQLFVSERTIEAHVANIMRKLGVPSRAGIAAWVGQQSSSPDT
jgi:DNA-binding CsgD family transcriptional regulator